MQKSKTPLLGGICLAEFVKVTSGEISREVFYDDLYNGVSGIASFIVLEYPVNASNLAGRLQLYQAQLGNEQFPARHAKGQRP
jgi:hypothetical protein